MRLVWTDELKTGVDDIDTQHKEIIDKINRLHEAVKEGRGREYIKEILDFLEGYINSPFSLEERYMADFNYPRQAMMAHVRQHKDLTEKYRELKKEFSEGHMLVTTLLAKEILGLWWVTHIKNTDRLMANFLRERIKGGGIT